MREHKVCVRCVMDTTDPLIEFDAQGVCSHCKRFDEYVSPQWKKCTREKLDRQIEQIKRDSKDKPYDAIVGLSGGVDSSYLLHYMQKEYDLRILVVHIDVGWNTTISVNNVKKITEKLGFELHEIAVNWNEMRDLQIAFLRSGVANCDAPQDHALFGSLYGYALKEGIRYVLSGFNFATESIFPHAWEHSAMDAMQLTAIHHRFGTVPLQHFPVVGFLKYYFYYPFFKKFRVISPLNYIDYNKNDAITLLQDLYGWENYGRKHEESVWTKFFQSYFLYEKFGYDKRKPHYSSAILSGQMNREEAWEALKQKPYNEDEIQKDLEYILNKLALTQEQWQEIMMIPKKSFRDYPNNHKMYRFKQKYIDPFFPFSYFWVVD